MPVKRTSHQTSGGPGGGGINSRSTAKVTTYHAGYNPNRVSPGGVRQLGNMRGDHYEGGSTGYRGERVFHGEFARPGQSALGNEVAYATAAKPGGSRTVMPTGGQGTHGPVAGTPLAVC